MSGNVEDLYLKGFMAYNAKDYNSAKAYWEQVIAQDPNHAKAKQGLEKLKGGKKRKRSSKEVFQEIKKLYSEKKFAEALRLCELLLKKHPDNKDLQNLRTKLTNRVKKGAAAPTAPVGPDQADKRSTMILATDAEGSVEPSDVSYNEDAGVQAEKLIQEGVSLYEIQNYEQAIDIWKKALALDPNNRIAKDYIKNVSALLAPSEGAKTTTAPAPTAPESQADAPVEEVDPNKPNKDDLHRIYNEAMEFYKARKYSEALDKWHFILKYYPNHQETLQCVEKTNGLIEKERRFVDMLERARQDISNGNTLEAERVLTQLAIEAPHLEGLEETQASLEQARAASASSSMDLQEEDLGSGLDEPSPKEYNASDDEITQYFSADAETSAARRVSKVQPVKKKKKAPVNVFKVFGVVALIAGLVVAGYFGWDAYNKRLRTTETNESVAIPIVQEVDWNSEQSQAENFLNLGSDFANEGEQLMAVFAYRRVAQIVGPRLAQLQKKNPTAHEVEIGLEIDRLNDIADRAKAVVGDIQKDIVGMPSDGKALERAKAELDRGNFAAASERFKTILMGDLDNERARELMGQAEDRLAFEKVKAKDLSGALTNFKRAMVLLSDFDQARRHSEVIDRFFSGGIDDEEKNQWFFFFD